MTEIGDRWYSRPGIWFWIVIALGAALRFYLVVFTDGTQDVAIWERHARDVRDHGLIGYYHGDPWRITRRSSAKSSRSFCAQRTRPEFHFAFFCAHHSRSSTPAQLSYFCCC